MLVKEWNELPEYMQVEEVRPYYEILRKTIDTKENL